MPLTPAQRAMRRTLLGGSDASLLFGDDPDPLRVFASKVLDDVPETSDATAELGTAFEPIVRERAAARLGLVIDAPTETIRHPKHAWMGANLDGRIKGGGLWEAKCIFDYRKSLRLGEPGTDEVLREHFFQVSHYLEVTDEPWAIVTYLIQGHREVDYVVERDRAIGAWMVEQEQKFWNEHVLARVPPAGDVKSQLAFNAARWPNATGEALVVAPGSAAEAALIELREAKIAAKAAKQQVDAARVRVENIMGSAPRIEATWGKATWLPSKSVAWSAVAKELRAPKDLIQRHTSVGRTFRASLGDGEDE